MTTATGSGSAGAALLLALLLAAAATVEAFMQPLQMMATGVKRNPNFGKLVGGCVFLEGIYILGRGRPCWIRFDWNEWMGPASTGPARWIKDYAISTPLRETPPHTPTR